MFKKINIFFLLLLHVYIYPREVKSQTVPEFWNSAQTRHFKFYYHPAAKKYVVPLINESEQHLNRLKRILGVKDCEPIEVRIARNPAEMKRIKPEAPPPWWATAVAMRGKRMIVMSLIPPGGSTTVDLKSLFVHEVVHILTYEATKRTDLPIWFNEGLAIYLSGEFNFARHKTLLSAALTGELLPISQLDDGYPAEGRKVNIAYAQSADLVKFINDKYGEGKSLIPQLFKKLRRGDEFTAAVASVCKRSIEQIEKQWLKSLEVSYRWVPLLTGGGAVWTAISVLLIIAYLKRKKSGKEGEVIEEFFAESHPGNINIKDKTCSIPKPSEDRRKIFHEGRFHTLH